MSKVDCITLQDWEWMYTIRIEAWCPFNPPSCTDLHIQTDTDWQTVLRPSVMFETVLANAYLVNDVKRLHVWAYARMSSMTYWYNYLRKKKTPLFFYLIDNLIIASQGDTWENDECFPMRWIFHQLFQVLLNFQEVCWCFNWSRQHRYFPQSVSLLIL